MNIENIINLFKEIKAYIFNVYYQNENKIIRVLIASLLSLLVLYLIIKLIIISTIEFIKNTSLNINNGGIKIFSFFISYDYLFIFIGVLLLVGFLLVFVLTFLPDFLFQKKYKNKFIFFIDDDVSTDLSNKKTLSTTKEKIGKNIKLLFYKYDFIVLLNNYKKLYPNFLFLKDDIDYIIGVSKNKIDSIYKNSPYNFYIKINVKNGNNFYPQIILKDTLKQKEIYLRKKPLIRTDYGLSIKYLNRILEDDFKYASSKNNNLYYVLQDYICYFNNISLFLNIVTNKNVLDKLESEEESKRFFNFLRFKNFIFNTENNKLIDIYYCFNVFFFLKDLLVHEREIALYHLGIKDNFQSIFILYKNIETNFYIFLKLIKSYRQLHIIFAGIFTNFAFIVNELVKENCLADKFHIPFYEIVEDYRNKFLNIIPEILLNVFGGYYNRYLIKEFLLEKNNLFDVQKKKEIANIFLSKFNTKEELYDKLFINNKYMLNTLADFKEFINRYGDNTLTKKI